MPIPVGTSNSSGVRVPPPPPKKPKKKKKKEEQQPTPPAGTAGRGGIQPYNPPPPDAAAKVVRAYYAATGKFPSPEKTVAFVPVVARDPSLQTQEDVNDLFQPWLREIEDPEDLSLDALMLGPTRDAWRKRVAGRRKMRVPKWTRAELADLPLEGKDADTTRQLANTTIHGEDMSYEEIADIYRARGWYLGTDLKARILARQAGAEVVEGGNLLFPDDDDNASIPGVKKFVRETGQASGTLMDPLAYARLRRALEDKDREDLSKDDLADLDALAARFAAVYPGFAQHYGGDRSRVKWDQYFDRKFSNYVVFANLGYALGMARKEVDPDGRLAEQARHNIAIATNNVIPANDDIHQVLTNMASLGDPDNPDSAMTELNDQVFRGYYRAHAEGWSDSRVVASYVHDFGLEALPDEYRGPYEEKRSVWDTPMQAFNAPSEGGDRAQVAEFINSLADGVNDEESFNPVLPATAPPEPAATGHGGRGAPALTNRTAEYYNNPTSKWMDTVAVPFIEDYIGHPLMRGLTWTEQQKNRVFLAAALASAGSFEDKGAHGGAKGSKSLRETQDELVKLPDEYRNDSAWNVATRLTSADPAGGQAFMEEVWRQNGWNPEEHGALFFASDLAWSIATDLLLDAGIGALVKVGATLSTSLARKTLSPRLSAKITDAERVLAEAGQGFAATTRGKVPATASETTAAADKLRDAHQALSLLERPAWYDTTAIGLSRGTQKAHQVQRFLGISEDGLSNETREKMLDLVAKIGERKGADAEDDILVMMNELRSKLGFKLDPGATFYGRMLRYHRIIDMGDNLDYARETILGGKRISGGVGNMNEEMAKYGVLTRMGHPATPAGKNAAAKELDEFLERASLIRGKNLEEVALKKRGLWDEMWKRIESNMGDGLTGAERNALIKWAKRSRTPLEKGWDKSRWSAVKAMQRVAAPRSKYAPSGSDTRAWADEDLALEAAKKAGLDDEAAKKAAKEFVSSPSDEYQLAKDLLFPVDPQKLIAFQRGHRALGWELRQTTGIVGIPFTNWSRYGLSPDAVTTAFKQFVIGRPTFAITVAGIDEFWRPEYQAAFWKRWFSKPNRRAIKGKSEEEVAAHFDRIHGGMLSEAMGKSDTWVTQTPDMLDADAVLGGAINNYPDYFNGQIEAWSKETSTRVLAGLPRREGESVDDWSERFYGALNDFATGKKGEAFAHLSDDEFEEVSATFRLKLQELGLDYRGTRDGTFVPPEQIAANREAQAVQLEQAWDDIDGMHSAQDALKTEMDELTGGASPKFNPPGKKFTAAWLRREHMDDVALDGRALTDDEVISAFYDDLSEATTKRRLTDDWQAAVMKQRGKGEEWARIKAIREERAANAKRLREAHARREQLGRAEDLRIEPGSRMDMQLRYWVARAKQSYMHDDELLDAVLSSKKLSRRQLKAIRGRLREQGVDLPTIIGVRAGQDWGPGSIPGLTQFNNATTMRLLDAMSGAMNRHVFVDQFYKEHDRLLAFGIEGEEATARAAAVAQREMERVLYKHAASPIENAGRNIALFLPAYRQATVYWSKVLARHPFLMTGIREKTKDWGIPLVRIGSYQFTVPKPFWTANDWADIGIPGFGPLIITPLRAANSFTGYTQTADGKRTYTGATKLDALSDIQPLSFTNKATSPTTWVDDALYGVLGENMYQFGEGQGLLGAGMGSLLRSLFRDQKKRVQLSMNIADAQISAGIRPDFNKTLYEMRDTPGWQGILEPLLEVLGDGQPEGFLAAFTRQFWVGRVSYKPADLARTDKLNLAQRLIGDEAMTVQDAKYEYAQAFGDEKKTQAVLAKYPILQQIGNFYNMNARERAEYWLSDANLRLLPYVSGRNNYDVNGRILVGAEYWKALHDGGIYRKSMKDYYADMESDWVNIGWYRTLTKLKSDHEAGLKAAHKWALTAVARQAKTPEQKERLLANLEHFEKWRGSDQPAKSKYGSPTSATPAFLEHWAKKDGVFDDVFKWNAYAIDLRFHEATQSVANGNVRAKILADYGFTGPAAGVQITPKRPKEAYQGGIEDKYSNAAAYGGRNWAANMGESLKVMDKLKSIADPDFRALYDARRSVSWATLGDTLKSDKSYNKYQQTKLATTEYYYLVNPATDMASLGVKIANPDRLNALSLKDGDLYALFSEKVKGMSTGSNEYKALRNARIAARDRLFADPAAEPLRNGIPGRLAKTWLTQPGVGLKVNHNYVSHIVAMMQKGGLDASALVAAYQARGSHLSAAQAKKVRTSTAWASVLSTAVVFRAEMKKQENYGWRGISPTSEKGTGYVAKLRSLAQAWGRADDAFSRQYEELGGDDEIARWLDALY